MSETILKLNIPIGIHKKISGGKPKKIFDTVTSDLQIAKIIEEAYEVEEAVNEQNIDHIAEECCDCITACVGLMYLNGLNKQDIETMMHKVLNKNRERGYLE